MSVETMAEMRQLIGQRVTVTLNREEGVTVTGVLVALDDFGEATVDSDAGKRRYCWPALAMDAEP